MTTDADLGADGSGSTWDAWIGRKRTSADVLALERARKLAATLDLEPGGLGPGDPLPPGWHWTCFHQAVPRSALADDGHERRGDFLPPVPLERRMWAGGRLRFLRPLRIGSSVQRVSTVRSIEEKEGRAGPLVFVTVEHRILADGGVAVKEEQDLVYLSRPERRGSDESEGRRADDVETGPAWMWSEPFTADEVTLFRFSALTFNGHRIHYDRRYATEVEGYPELVVHGPLLALSLLGAGARWALEAGGAGGGLVGWRFAYRALSPVFCHETVQLRGRSASGDARGLELRVEHSGRGPAMRGELAPM